MSDHGFSKLNEILIQRTILAMICDVDLLELRAAERLFASRVEVDYTSLWGGSPMSMTPAELVGGWGDLLPGFDATWHELGEIDVHVSGTSAEAACPVAARHWIGADVWLPKGRYEFTLVKAGAAWRIARMKLQLTEEIGDRALVDRARSRAKQGGRTLGGGPVSAMAGA